MWDLAGAGDGWGTDNRIYSRAEDGASQGNYGYRMGQAIYNDVSVQTTLDEHAATLLGISKNPYNMLDLEALNIAPARFSDYDVGDTVRVQLYSYGFGGYDHNVRIEAREFNPATGTCRLVVREAE